MQFYGISPDRPVRHSDMRGILQTRAISNVGIDKNVRRSTEVFLFWDCPVEEIVHRYHKCLQKGD